MGKLNFHSLHVRTCMNWTPCSYWWLCWMVDILPLQYLLSIILMLWSSSGKVTKDVVTPAHLWVLCKSLHELHSSEEKLQTLHPHVFINGKPAPQFKVMSWNPTFPVWYLQHGAQHCDFLDLNRTVTHYPWHIFIIYKIKLFKISFFFTAF